MTTTLPGVCAVCAAPAHPGAPLPLCLAHLLEAHDWAAGEFGVTDLLPSPCAFCGSRLGVRYPSGWLCAVCEWRAGELPPEGAAASRVDVVYYLRYRDRIKIGTTANPAQRFASLPHDELLAFERGDRRREQRRHAEFAALRIPGTEWFETDARLLRHVAGLRASAGDPWDLLARWRSERAAQG
ncbi:GIY-YIG nuclease family protein [Leifsonia sp. 71-9]|mgnify:CR=1 FL=1|uniref:GIY-YIG nuclease family protein n=1 Tax=Leifsonia sp. 71-9 TaxID=1895934 RepID=UPI000926DBD7|nr:GIY-YIG nuclease family protein [Leifsonia sp. 71-9]OJX75523.1 MAG: ATPase [Leifsonia sp. 71-9]